MGGGLFFFWGGGARLKLPRWGIFSQGEGFLIHPGGGGGGREPLLIEEFHFLFLGGGGKHFQKNFFRLACFIPRGLPGGLLDKKKNPFFWGGPRKGPNFSIFWRGGPHAFEILFFRSFFSIFLGFYGLG